MGRTSTRRASASQGSFSSRRILVYTFLASILWSVFLGSKVIPSIDVTLATSQTSIIPVVSSTEKSRLVDCYLGLEAKKQALIDQWLDLDAPLLDAVVRNVSVISQGGPPIFYVYQYSLVFVVKHLNAKEWAQASWYCNDETHIAFKRTASPFVHLLQCKFNSTLSPEEEERQPLLQSVWPSKQVGFRVVKDTTNDQLNLSVDPNEGVQVRYDDYLSEFLECDHREQKYNEDLFGSGRQSESHLQDSPSIGSCIIIREIFQYLPAWIEYHRLMGVKHFWVFVNQPWEKSISGIDQPSFGRYERSYITYIPYNFYWGDHNNHSKFHKAARDVFWQEAMQMKCLYNSKRLGLNWVTTTDVDEYIFVNDSSYHFEGAGSNEWDNQHLPKRVFPLQAYLRDHEEDFRPLAAVSMNSVFFGRNVQTEGVPPDDRMVMHYIYRPTHPFWSRWKQIYHVENANVAGIHEVLAAKKWESTRLERVYFQHYKKPHKGVFWTDKDNITRDSKMRDLYLESVVAAMTAPDARHVGT